MRCGIADELQRLATRIDKYGDFTEVLQELRDLLSGQDRVIDGAGEAAKAGRVLSEESVPEKEESA